MNKSFKKYLRAILFSLALFQAAFVAVPQLALAVSPDQICEPDQGAGASNNINRCVHNIYLFTFAFVASVSVLMFVVAGYMYMTGDEKMIGRAKAIITRTLIAILLLLATFVILNTLDPNLTKVPDLKVQKLDCGAFNCKELPPLPTEINENGYTNADNISKNCKTFRTEAEAQAEMVTVSIPLWKTSTASGTGNITVQKCISDLVLNTFKTLSNSSPHFPIHAWSGYTWRPAVGSSTLSVHALGLAIDLNPNENYMIRDGTILAGSFWKPCPGSDCSPYSFPSDGVVVNTMKSSGFGWGGEWRSSKDYMHFSCAANEGGNCKN